MFSHTITVVTALTMLAHSVWGCCCHHEHDGGSAVAGISEVVAPNDHDTHACSHAHSQAESHKGAVETATHDHSSHDEDGHQHGACNEIRCNFVKTSSPSVDGLWTSWFATWPELSATPELTAATGHREHGDDGPPPLSAHASRALTQHWLL